MEGKENKEQLFSQIYTKYYPKLLRFAQEYVGDVEEAENLVQDLFLYLWNHYSLLDTVHNLNAFLFTLVKNRSIDFLRNKIRIENTSYHLLENIEYQLNLEALESLDVDAISKDGMERLIQDAINTLPVKCREIFVLSKIKGMKYTEIAETLHLSVSTVDNQMGIALRKLRERLKEYICMFILILMNL